MGKDTRETVMKIRVFTVAWGECEDTYRRLCLPSVSEDFGRLRAEGHEVKEKLFTDKDSNIAELFHESLKKCIEKDEYLFLLMPDTVWGRGSVYNIVKYGIGQNACVLLPHLRAIKEEWELEMPCDIKHLVDELWRVPHQTTILADVRRRLNGSTTRQALWDMGSFTLCNHYYPTVYFMKPNEAMDKWWEGRDKRHGWINYDTNFLDHVVKEQNYRVIGSSEVAFCVELEWKKQKLGGIGATGRDMPRTIRGYFHEEYLFPVTYHINRPLDGMQNTYSDWTWGNR